MFGLFDSREMKAAKGVIAEISIKHEDNSFSLVEEHLLRLIKKNQAALIANVQSGTSPRQIIYAEVADIASRLLETGRFHLYRGVINPIGPGAGLSVIYRDALEQMVAMGACTRQEADENIKAHRELLKEVG